MLVNNRIYFRFLGLQVCVEIYGKMSFSDFRFTFSKFSL